MPLGLPFSALKGRNMIAQGKASRRAPPWVNRAKKPSPAKAKQNEIRRPPRLLCRLPLQNLAIRLAQNA
jgi:hypothetical protein